eukprot:1924740-Alexandrium_andersonii.AAC.1
MGRARKPTWDHPSNAEEGPEKWPEACHNARTHGTTGQCSSLRACLPGTAQACTCRGTAAQEGPGACAPT